MSGFERYYEKQRKILVLKNKKAKLSRDSNPVYYQQFITNLELSSHHKFP